MFNLESDNMTVLWPTDILILLFIRHSQITYQVAKLLYDKFLDLMCRLQNYQMTVLWEIESLTFTFIADLYTFIASYLHTCM